MGATPARCAASPVRVHVSPPGPRSDEIRDRLDPHRTYVRVLGAGAASTADVVILDATDAGGVDADERDRVLEQSMSPVLVLIEAPRAGDEESERRAFSAVLRLLRSGAGGCTMGAEDPLRLVEAILTVASGAVALDHDLAVGAAALSARLLDLDRSPADLIGLSRREEEVLERLDSGATARQIGAELFVSHETVRSHLKRIYRKLGVHDRAAAVERARLDGILPS